MNTDTITGVTCHVCVGSIVYRCSGVQHSIEPCLDYGCCLLDSGLLASSSRASGVGQANAHTLMELYTLETGTHASNDRSQDYTLCHVA